MPSNIKKIYLSNFLVGMVFWYGIEKLFMQHVGISAAGIGLVAAVGLAFNLIFDIPSGILADKWSRKGMLFVSAAALALSSLTLGLSNGLALYLVGYILYGVYVVCASGTFQALMYDSLHEHGLSGQYSKIMGRAYALFLVGAGVANLASGFIVSHSNLRMPFLVSIIPCVINMLVVASIKEPAFHKAEQKEKMLHQLKGAFVAISQVTLLRGLAIIMTALTVVELFKSDFGQLYMLRYTSSAEMLGILWAAYAVTWAFGSFIAHKLRGRLHLLVLASTLPLVLMSFIDHWVALVLFMVQSTAYGALFNQIETRVQDSTPSSVRASILSVLSSLGRGVSIPASIGIGWLIQRCNVLWALYAVTIIAVLVLLYWFWLRGKTEQIEKPISAT